MSNKLKEQKLCLIPCLEAFVLVMFPSQLATYFFIWT